MPTNLLQEDSKVCYHCFWWPLISGHYNPCILTDNYTHADDTCPKYSTEDLDVFEAYKIAKIDLSKL